jgi:ATP-dependent phosphofructokinase / diphosphate-dependent phosphofructokinase
LVQRSKSAEDSGRYSTCGLTGHSKSNSSLRRKMKPRIGILTSGGDCPGLNAVLRAVVLAADKLGWEVVGFRDGFEGLLPPGNHVILDRQAVNGIMALGGTILGTTNRGHFVAKVGAGDRTIVPAKIIADARKILEDLRVRALVIVGGDGSLVTAQQLQEAGINCIGVPKTIDNDLEATATTFGFDSAVDVVGDALDRLHTTATSHRRVIVVEVMGRHAGWIALQGGIAGGADVILIPEISFDYEKIASVINSREAAGYLGTVVVAAEGARPKHGEQVKRDVAGGEFRLGGIGEIVAREIAKRTGKETRCCVLGHLQRGGAPTTLDRILATRFGVKAVQLANEGHFGSMVSYQNYQVRHVPIAEAVNRLKLVPPNGELVQTARDVDISFGD